MTKTEKFNFVANRASCSKYEFISVTEMWNMWNLWELFYFHYFPCPLPPRPDTCSTIIVKLRVNMGSESTHTHSRWHFLSNESTRNSCSTSHFFPSSTNWWALYKFDVIFVHYVSHMLKLFLLCGAINSYLECRADGGAWNIKFIETEWTGWYPWWYPD